MGPDRSGDAAFLASTTRAFLNEEPPRGTLGLAAHSLDWGWILRWAEDERLAPLLYAVFRALPLPDAVLDRLRAAWLSGWRQHLLGVEQLSRLLAAFERARVPVIPLKGPALAEALYRNPGLRPFTDLDLLIRPADLPRAVSLLSALGYRHLDEGRPLPYELAYSGAACFVSAGRGTGDVPLDVHWKLLDYRSGRRAAATDFQEIWDRAVESAAWDQPARGLCPEDLLIYLALHWAVHHAFSGLIWRLDLALLLRRYGGTLDWESVAERAHRWGVRGALYFALREVQERFAVAAPPSFVARLRPRGPRQSALEWLRRHRHSRLERLDYLVPLLLMDRGSDLLRLLAAGAFPAGGWARSRYGTRSLPRAYLAHYWRTGRVCVGTVSAGLGRAGCSENPR